MAKIIPISEHFQHFLADVKESFWGELYGQTRQAWQQFFELQSERQRDRFSGWALQSLWAGNISKWQLVGSQRVQQFNNGIRT
jgi:hypothetical protein